MRGLGSALSMRSPSTTRDRVAVVALSIADVQMAWTHASSNVAMVANPLTATDAGAAVPFQNQSMGVMTLSRDLDHAVARAGLAAHPQPAVARLIDLLPEPFDYRPTLLTASDWPGSFHATNYNRGAR
jgi:hypothetical protein